MTNVPPPPGPRRASVVSPLVMGDTQTAPPGAERMLLVDAQDRRVVLIELRLDRGASPDAVRRRFRRLFRDVFGTSGPPQPVPIARHYMRCVLAPDEITRLVRGGDAGGDRGLGLIYRVWPDLVLRAHLDECPACRAWMAYVESVSLRVRTAEPEVPPPLSLPTTGSCRPIVRTCRSSYRSAAVSRVCRPQPQPEPTDSAIYLLDFSR